MLYEGNLTVREIPCSKRKIKYAYDVIDDSSGYWDLNKPMISRILLRYLFYGNTVTIVDQEEKVIRVFGEIKNNEIIGG